MNKQNSQSLVAQWRNSEINNPAGPLFITGEFAEAEIVGESFNITDQCGTGCSGSVTRNCC